MLKNKISTKLKDNLDVFEQTYVLWEENPTLITTQIIDVENDKLYFERWKVISNSYKNFVFEIDLITIIAQQISSNETFLNTLQRLKFDNLISQNNDNQIIIKYYSFLNPIFELDFEYKKGNV